MFTYLRQLWRSPDLRKRILFTVGMLVLYRLISHVPIPTSDPVLLRSFLGGAGFGNSPIGIFAALTGGAVKNFSVALLGLSPYINASIILQLATVIFPKLEAISKEGVQGQQQINRYTRWVSYPLAFLQSYGFLVLLNAGGAAGIIDVSFPHILLPMLFVTAGCVTLMWMGELITEKGIGNGISMLIFTGVVANIPQTLGNMLQTGGSKLPAFYLFIIVSIAGYCRACGFASMQQITVGRRRDHDIVW